MTRFHNAWHDRVDPHPLRTNLGSKSAHHLQDTGSGYAGDGKTWCQCRGRADEIAIKLPACCRAKFYAN
jgi:hypothetical protein